jgi:hypothetical protein
MLRFVKNLGLCPKSLRFSHFIQKPCISHAFSKSFAHCSKSFHSLALPKIFALFALCPKTLQFSRFLKTFALYSKSLRFSQNLSASPASLKVPALLTKSSRFFQHTH